MKWRKLAVAALVFGLSLAQPAPLPRGGTLAGVWIELEGGCDRVLAPGETIAFRAGVSDPAYLYVFDVRVSDTFVRLVPRDEAPVPSAGGGEVVRFPQSPGVRYRVTGPAGEGYLYLLATRVPLAPPLEASASELARLLDGLDYASWGDAWCRYWVAAPPTAQAVVAIETEPAGLTVYVDGVRLGASPLTASLAPGVHRLRLEGAGAVHEQTLRLAPGDRFSLRLRLPIEASPPVVRFAVRTVPDGARVYIDGRYVCAAPCELEGGAGLRLLRLERPGYQVWGAYVRIGTQDAESRFAVTLKEASATLTVRTDADAALFLDGMPLGWVRAGEARTLPVAPGWHEVVALAPGREAARERILILDGDREEMELDLDAL